MKESQQRVRIIAAGLLFLGGMAWVNTIGTFVLTSNLTINAEMILLFAGIGLLRQNGRRIRYILSLIVLTGIIVILIPVTAYTISPTVSVSLFGEEFTPYSIVAQVYIIVVTLIYLATLVWLFMMLRRDLYYEESSRP